MCNALRSPWKRIGALHGNVTIKQISNLRTVKCIYEPFVSLREHINLLQWPPFRIEGSPFLINRGEFCCPSCLILIGVVCLSWFQEEECPGETRFIVAVKFLPILRLAVISSGASPCNDQRAPSIAEFTCIAFWWQGNVFFYLPPETQ